MKKIVLVFIGVFLSFIVLEVFLQSVGFVLVSLKNYKKKKLINHQTITILCLGESTTDGQWPPILQEILDKKAKYKKFTVIDEGAKGTNSFVIASKTQQYLIKYNPDVVVSMIGINDFGLRYRKSKLKILNLFRLLQNHVKTKFLFDYSDLMMDSVDYQSMNDINNGNFDSAETNYLRLWKLSNKTSVRTFFRLLELYSLTGEMDKFEIVLKESDAKIKCYALSKILEYLVQYKKYSKKQLYDYVKENQNKIISDESTVLLLKEYGFDDLIENIEQNKIYEIETLAKKTISSKDYKVSSLIANYNYIVDEVYKHNLKTTIMPMQYPIISLNDLKVLLQGSRYYDGLVFIDNVENFKEMLKTHKITEIFTDMFGGSFGHCTKIGNTLIAENVASKVLSLYDKEKV